MWMLFWLTIFGIVWGWLHEPSDDYSREVQEHLRDKRKKEREEARLRIASEPKVKVKAKVIYQKEKVELNTVFIFFIIPILFMIAFVCLNP